MSPILNFMHHCSEPRPQLTSILWMTPWDALLPQYQVPLPPLDKDQMTDEVYPTPLYLRFLAITGLFTNWVSWLSRVEASASLGLSRFSPFFVGVPVAAGLLQPLSLGCGQAPVLDIWPLWLLRRFFNLSLELSLCIISLTSSGNLRVHFPFSDLDEI